MMELTPGLELGARFVLVRRLGQGGTSEVWLADDAARGERVALKIIDESGAHDPGLAGRLAAEIARSRSLDGEFAVPVHGVEQAGGCTCIVVEYQAGGDLGQFRGRSFESWAKPVCELVAALAAAHARGLVHRDLKCSNVLLDGAGRARLSDFGLAGQAGSRVPAGGSPYNASPQQLRGEPAAFADDLYALGALLYELIAGHPPWYPEITRDRVLYEPVPPLLPRGEVPVGVRELALRLLAKSPQERPASATAVGGRLAALSGDDDDGVLPQTHALAATTMPQRPRRRWLAAILMAAVLAALAAFILLPQYFARRNTGIEEQARAEAEAQSRAREALAQQAARDAAVRAAAETMRATFNEALAALDARAASRWATDVFAKARAAGEQAAQSYAVGDYAAAADRWESASAQLAELEKRRPLLLKETLERGRSALAQGRTADARAAFGLALAIEPGQDAARAGMEHAARLDEVLAIVDAATADERAGRLDAAARGFRQALAQDSAAPGARAGLARLAARAAGDAYATAMSRGLADLAAGRTESARAAFQRALAVRPDSREAREAIATLDQGQRTTALQLLESRARSAESDERWDEALGAWQEAAALEPALAPAREGIARCQPRAELQRRIDVLIRKPENLWDPGGRGEARSVLAMAAEAGNPRQRLAVAAQELEHLAAAAQTPVRVRLESDGQTSVAIYRIGQYGVFAERSVELLPGRYTVVGTRTGYRDVRRELVLTPGIAPPPVVIRCEERI